MTSSFVEIYRLVIQCSVKNGNLILAVAVRPYYRNGFTNTVYAQKLCLDICQVYAPAFDFFLKIFSPQIIEAAVFIQSTEVAGAVDTRRRIVERRFEGFGGLIGLPPITDSEVAAVSGDLPELAGV